MTLPDKDHPFWKVLQALISLVGLTILATHGIDGSHAGGVDLEDGAGVVGAGAAGRLLWQVIKS